MNNKQASKYIEPLNINGLKGRMLYMSSASNKHKRQIVFIYGHHATIERNFGIMADINKYGDVTAPDLPGFGGMDSFYSIGLQPTLDNYADYLASFLRLRFKNKKITLAGFSFGFLVIHRLLQRHPELANQIDMVVSIAGFINKDAFLFSPNRFRFYNLGTSIISKKIPATIFRYVFLNRFVLRRFYANTYLAKSKFSHLSETEVKQALEVEVHLWQINDVQTWAFTAKVMINADLMHPKIDKVLWHVTIDSDQYFDGKQNIRFLKDTYKKVHVTKSEANNHSPTVIATVEEAKHLIPNKLRQEFSKI